MTSNIDRVTPCTVRRVEIPASVTQPLVTPLFPSVVYRATDADEMDRVYERRDPGFTYAREGHPNAEIVANRVAGLEGAEAGVAVASGMAAAGAVVLALLKAGDHVVAANQLYGRTLRMLGQELPRLGVDVSLIDATDASAVARAIRPNTRMVLVEVVSNPLLRVIDIPAIGQSANSVAAEFVVDNTFPTPLGYRPFRDGATIVLHSVTKLLAGHSDVTLGAICGSAERMARIREVAVTWGWTPSPFDCWLSERGMHTLALRFERSQQNAAALADFFANQSAVARVIYPGRSDHPDHAVACRIFQHGFGAMLSFELRGGRTAANRFLRRLQNIPFAPTLGDVSTMVSHPASTSHRALAPDERVRLGIDDGLIRISVGIESLDLLVTEFETALR